MNHQVLEIFERYLLEVKNLSEDDRKKFLNGLILEETGEDNHEMIKLLWEEVTELIRIYRRGIVDGMEEMKVAIEKMKPLIPLPPPPDKI